LPKIVCQNIQKNNDCQANYDSDMLDPIKITWILLLSSLPYLEWLIERAGLTTATGFPSPRWKANGAIFYVLVMDWKDKERRGDTGI